MSRASFVNLSSFRKDGSSDQKTSWFSRFKHRLQTIDKMWYAVLVFLIALFFLYVYWETQIPMSRAPDELVRIPITDYIAEHGTLPNGWDPAVRIHNWGFSYALRPILVNALSALFLKAAMLFSGDLWVQVLVVRSVAALCGVVLVYYMFRIARALKWAWVWAWTMGIFTALIPQVSFLSSYLNNDIFSMACCAAIVYAWIVGIRSRWSWSCCTRLAITLGLTILSYYNAYPFVLFSIPLFFGSAFYKGMSKEAKKSAWQKTLYIIVLTFLLAGWWFIRNLILYDGDLLGSKTREIMGELFAYPDLKPFAVRRLAREGVPFLATLSSDLLHDSWFLVTMRTSFASIGFVEIYLDELVYYHIYFWMLGVGWVSAAIAWFCWFGKACKDKFKDPKSNLNLQVIFYVVLSAVLVFLLAMYYSWSDDYQPQGRYILPGLVAYILVMFTGFRAIVDLLAKVIRFKYTAAVLSTVVGILCTVYIVFCQVRMLQLTTDAYHDLDRVSTEYIYHRVKYGPAFETDGEGGTYEEDVKEYADYLYDTSPEYVEQEAEKKDSSKSDSSESDSNAEDISSDEQLMTSSMQSEQDVPKTEDPASSEEFYEEDVPIYDDYVPQF